MWPFPKLLQIWREPKEFTQAARGPAKKIPRPWWVRPFFLAVWFGMLLVVWYLLRFNPSKNPVSFPAAVGIALPLSIFLVYVVPMLDRLLPPPHSEVRVYKNCIVRIHGYSVTRLTLEEISSYYWASHEDFIILAVMTNRKQPTVFGVPDAETKQQIENVLESLGIPQSSAEPEDRTDAASDTGSRDE